MTLYKQVYTSPLGKLSLVASDTALRGIWFEDQKYFERGLEKRPLLETHPILEETKRLLDRYFQGEAIVYTDLPLSPLGTPFQQKVWSVLLMIPFGEVITYGDLAKELDCLSAQAVGNAVGKNPISLLIPCHRVLSRYGKLTGYAGGLDRKLWLLNHEAQIKEKSC